MPTAKHLNVYPALWLVSTNMFCSFPFTREHIRESDAFMDSSGVVNLAT
ncbi:hypothetical protein A8926_7355 [Saccharopolyspora spinosa]|uniref:Uncharacterized protein n=1 Tax=Saccharopolyspora spinosa TaxID=60894 RepID=A0A2N3Y8D5_SACSN|nr:hypothetical protein A8926_7355 [Saccharopolyspora spinosa]